MKRTTMNFTVDVVAFAAFALLTATGLVERYMLPPGSGHFRSLWGMNRHQWGEVHFWIALALMAALAVHILLHWKWIVSVLRGRATDNSSGWRVALGVVGLFGLVGLSLAPFLAEVEQTGEPGRRQQQQSEADTEENGEHATDSGEVRGSMTLDDVEQTTGVSAAVIVRELGLPPDVPRDINLGRLRREYEFEMEDVRRVVKDHSPQ